MSSYKNASYVIIGLSLLIIIFAVAYDVVMIQGIKNQASEMITMADKMIETNSEYNSPLRVIRNVMTQYTEKNGSISETMRGAYDRNLEASLKTNRDLSRQLQQMNSEIVHIRYGWLGIQQRDLEQSLMLVQESYLINQKVEEYLLLSFDSKSLDGLDFVTEVEIRQADLLRQLADTLHNRASQVVNRIIQMANVMIGIIVFTLILLLLMTVRFRYFLKSFIFKSYQMVEDHDFNTEALSDYKSLFKEEYELMATVNRVFAEQDLSMSAKAIVRDSYDFDEILERLFLLTKNAMGINRIGIAYIDYGSGKIISEGAVSDSGEIRLDVGYSVKVEDTTLKKALRDRKGIINNDLEYDRVKRPWSESIRLILEEGMNSNMIIPLMSGNEVFGFVFFSSFEKAFFNEEHMRQAEKILYELSEILKRTYLLKVVFNRFTKSIAELVDNRDNETGDHLNRMTQYSVVIADALQKSPIPAYRVDRKFVQEIKSYAALHDIGKVAITDEILKKPGKLSEEEFAIMKQHTHVGHDVISKIRESLKMFDENFFKTASEITYAHHEKWDGSGYPQALSGNSIPLAARIVAIADVFDALTSKRVYKNAMSFDESLRIIKENKGKHFDPYLVDVFISQLSTVKTIYNEHHNTVYYLDELAM